MPEPENDGGELPADDAESFAEEYIVSATSGETVDMDANDEVTEEEEGGPFLVLEPGDDDVPGDAPLGSGPNQGRPASVNALSPEHVRRDQDDRGGR